MLSNYLKKTGTLWLLFATAIVMMVVFEVVMKHFGFTLLDMTSSPTEARALLSQMSTEQRLVHAVLTATVDVVYPLALGGLLAGIAFRCFEKFGKYLAILPLAGMSMDFVEGIIQILALTEIHDALQLKAIVTPAKYALFSAGFIVAIIAGVRWSVCKIRGLGDI